MKQFQILRRLYGAEIVARVWTTQDGIRASVTGGQRPHVGASSAVDRDGVCETFQQPGHKDAFVSERWARGLADAGYRPVKVEAGIHYDDLSKEGIQAVLDLSEDMLAEALELLRSNP